MTFLGNAWEIVATGFLLLAAIGLIDLWLTGVGCSDCGNTGYDADSGEVCPTCDGDGQLDDETMPQDPDRERDWRIADEAGAW